MEPDLSPAEMIARSEGLLLDFDGPVCTVYAESKPSQIVTDLSTQFQLNVQTDDPLDLIREAIRVSGSVEAIHRSLTEAEIEAVKTAVETPGVRRLVETYHGSIAIVSNNAAEAIDYWLRKAGLEASIDVITGRDPLHMKPSPIPLARSAEALDLDIHDCVFIGDSTTDIEAAVLAGCPIISFANKPTKHERFEAVGGSVIVEQLAQLT